MPTARSKWSGATVTASDATAAALNPAQWELVSSPADHDEGAGAAKPAKKTAAKSTSKK